MTQSLPPDGELAPPPPPAPCAYVKGILFGRKACGVMTTLRCRRCQAAICNEHAFFDEGEPPQALCPSCDAQGRSSDDSGFSYRDTNWNSSGSPAPAVAGGAAGAAAGAALADEDRAGLTPPATWHGEAPPADGDAAAGGDEAFDAS